MKTVEEKIAVKLFVGETMESVIYPNVEDWKESFWKNKYLISIGEIGTQRYAVNADNEQDALDYAIDYIVEHFPGCVMSREEEETEEYLEEYIVGGNEGRYLNFGYHELRIEQL